MSSHTHSMPSQAGEDSVPAGRGQLPATEAEAARGERDRALAGMLQQAASGNTSAFEAFYDLTLGYAQALARRMLRGSGDLEDVLASAYFQVWRELECFDAQRGSAVTWLLTCARGRWMRCVKRVAAARKKPATKKPTCRATRPAPTSCCKASRPAPGCARSSPKLREMLVSR